MKKLVFGLIVCGFLSHLSAQTWQDITANVPGPITSGNHRPLDTDGTRLYVLGNRGVYVSADNGATFTPVNAVAGASYSLTNQQHRFVRHVNGYVWVGSDPGSDAFNIGHATLHRLVPGQSVWEKCSNGFPVGTTGNQADDIAYDATTGTYYAVGAIGGVFVSTNGLDWEQRNTGLTGIGLPASVVAFNGQAFVLRPLANVHRTTNQGLSWTALNSHPSTSSGFLTEYNGRVFFSTSGNTQLEDGLYYTDDNGATWNFIFTNALKLTADVSRSGDLLYAGGLFGDALYEPVRGRPGFKFSATGGITWDPLPTNGLGSLNVSRVVRQGNYLFMHSGTNLYRLDVSGVDFTPATRIARQPATSVNIYVGQSFTLSVLAGGQNLSYQWRLNGTNLPGATAASYAVANAQTNQSGPYTVVVSGDLGSVTSAVSTVSILPRIEGKVDITSTSSQVGGQLFMLPNLELIAINGASVRRLDTNGAVVVSRTVSGANFSANLLDRSNRVLLGSSAGAAHRLRRVLASTLADDPGFNQLTANGTIRTVAELPGRGYLVGGDFTSVTNAGVATNASSYLCLINYAGLVEQTFNPTNGPNSSILRVVVEAETNVYVLGGFTAWAGTNLFTSSPSFVKLFPNGQRDTSFTYQQLAADAFLAPVGNGKLFAVLSSGAPKLLNRDGTIDPAFNTANLGFVQASGVRDVSVGESNKLYVTGSFTSFGGITVGRYLRLNADGTRDTTFDSASGPSTGGLISGVYDPRGYLHITRDTAFGNFQGYAYGAGPYRVLAGTNASAATGFAAWKAQYTFPPGQDGEGADPDGDDLSNVFEYYFGSHPINAASGAAPVVTVVTDGGQEYPAITFVRSQSATGVTLLPQASSDVAMTDSLGTVVHSVVNLGGGLEQVTIRSAVSRAALPAQFLRIRLSVP